MSGPGVILDATAALATADPTAGRIAALRRLPEGPARRAAAGELGVVFLTQLIAALRRTVPESGLLPRGPNRSVYEGMFDRSVAEALAAGDPLGLTRLLGGKA